MVLTAQIVAQMKKECHELNQLPKDWTFNVNPDNERRISFVKPSTRATSYNHPTLGGLPKPWILRLVRNKEDRLEPMYYNRETKASTKKDPRYMDSALALHSDHAPKSLWIAATTTKNSSKIDMNTLKRTPIERRKNIRDQYKIVHAIDPGDGTIGGMNGGVFVVHMVGLANRIFVEKRFKPEDVSFGKKEIEMVYRVRHPALTFYSAAMILEYGNRPQASLYVEYCDRGSLEDLIKAYGKRRSTVEPNVLPPEAFAWHVLTGLCDALAYLQTGLSLWRTKDARRDPNWIPIIHRDIKPDNILLRTRSTLGSKKYFYCVLSDFGLVCEDRDDRDPLADQHQTSRYKLGTKAYWAPELCYNPYPQASYGPGGDTQTKVFPNTYRHSRHSDVWALGACVFNLCSSGGSISHLNFDKKPRNISHDTYMEGMQCRQHYLTIPSRYTTQLRKAILLATKLNPRERPDPVELLRILEPLVDASGFAEQGSNGLEPIPDWATKVHEYFSRAESLYRD